MEVDDSDGENMQQEDEELVAFSDFHSDEEGQDPHLLTNALGSANASIPGVRKYKKADQRARMTVAESKIQEILGILEKLETASGRQDVDREGLKEEKKKWHVKLEKWKKEKLQARNAINHRRLQMRVRQKYGSAKQQKLDEMDKEFSTAYMEAYAALTVKYCDHATPKCESCRLCYARILFGNLTCLAIASDKIFVESQKTPDSREQTKLPKIVADTPEEAKKIKRERDRTALRAFRERQKNKIQGMDKRLKFYEDAKDHFRKFYYYIGLDKPKIVADEQTQRAQPYLLDCARNFAEVIDIDIPKANIHLESVEFLEKFVDYLAETFLLLFRRSLGFEQIREESCLQCHKKIELKEDFHHYIDGLPANEGVAKQFEDVIKSYLETKKFVADCRICDGKDTLQVSQYFSMNKTRTEYVLVCLPNGKIYFPKAEEYIFDGPMELVFFVTVTAHVYVPNKKVNGKWMCHVDGKWSKIQLPLLCFNVPYVVFKKKSDVLP